MQVLELANHSKISVGVKQSMKAIQADRAAMVYIAEDADTYVINQVVELANQKSVQILKVNTMKELGRACKIDVGAATAVIENISSS